MGELEAREITRHWRPWRTGELNSRTIFVQQGAEPSRNDQMIGAMDNALLSAVAVLAVNEWLEHNRWKLA